MQKMVNIDCYKNIIILYKCVIKKISLIITFCMILSFVSSCNNSYDSVSTYILPENACMKLFNMSSHEFAKSPEVPWTDNFCISAKVDESGNLLVTLTKQQEELWRSAMPVPNNSIEQHNVQQFGIYISSDFSEVIAKCYKENANSVITKGAVGALQGCYVHKLLDGCDSSELCIKYKVVDAKTGVVVYQADWPYEDEYFDYDVNDFSSVDDFSAP